MVVMITGGAGFVGHHLVEGVLRDTSWDVVITDRLTYAGNFNRLTDMGWFHGQRNRVRVVYHNLASPLTEEIHRQIGPLDYVWHLAAESHVDRSLVDATPFAQSAVLGTVNLLQYLRERQQGTLKRYIGFNTDECFGPARVGQYHSEAEKFYPSNPYSASKAGQWAMEFAFAHSFKMPISMVHSMNIVGERQNGEKFVPKTVRAILEGEAIPLHGSPEHPSSRCWIHAREVCNALIFLTEHGENEQTYNVVGEERTVLELAEMFSAWVVQQPAEVEWIDFHSVRPGHDLRYALDGSKLQSMGFAYTYPLEKSLRKMVAWMVSPEHRHWLYH